MEEIKHSKRTRRKIYKTKGRERFIFLSIRISPQENEELLKKLEQTKMNKSEFVRKAISNVEIKEKPDREFYNTTQQLIRIGNNLNQIAKKANSLDFINTKEYQENADELKNLITEIKEKYLEENKL